MNFWSRDSRPQVKKCWESEQLDESFLFHVFSYGFFRPMIITGHLTVTSQP